MVKAPGEGEKERDGVGGQMLVVAAAHIGDDDVALDQRIAEPRSAKACARRTNPAELLCAGKECGRHRAIGGICIGNLVFGVLRVLEGFHDRAGDRPPDLLRP